MREAKTVTGIKETYFKQLSKLLDQHKTHSLKSSSFTEILNS